MDHAMQKYTQEENQPSYLLGICKVGDPAPRSLNDYAAKRLNQLYLQLRKTNPDQDLTHFMAQLIFCFFAQDTGIFYGKKMFTAALRGQTREQAEEYRPHMEQLFRVFDIPEKDRTPANTPEWAKRFPYVNGNLFSGSPTCPEFDATSYKYLDWAGETSWREIDPDIFGTMIQAMAGPEKRGELGSHYTSVENILRVLNPLFLDELRETLEKAGKSKAKLTALKERLRHIRVFDPACGSGNFLVIAYKELREIQNEIDIRLSIEQPDRRSVLKLGNFYGIEIEPFCTEIARLALIVAKFQCDEIYITQQEALNELLPLEDTHKAIKCGNALRMDWLDVCPPEEGSETYICGNPPYRGKNFQTKAQKADIATVFHGLLKSAKSLDYIAGWFMKAVLYGQNTPTTAAFVSTNSICQGSHVPLLWPLIFDRDYEISFAHNSFKWKNNASHNAGVTVSIIGLAPISSQSKTLFITDQAGQATSQTVESINAYLVPGKNMIVEKRSTPLSLDLPSMSYGNKASDGKNLLMTGAEKEDFLIKEPTAAPYLKQFLGSEELIDGIQRYCLWIHDEDQNHALALPAIRKRVEAVKQMRLASPKASTRKMADAAYKFAEIREGGDKTTIVIPRIFSENYLYLPVGLRRNDCIISDRNYALYDTPLWPFAVIASHLHLTWVKTVCGKMKTDPNYAATMGWNTFPVPKLTERDKTELTESAERILLIRERHFPAALAQLYTDATMPEDLRAAHAQNDELVERIFAGKVFRNDTERLETLFDLYSKMIARQETKAPKKTSPKVRTRKRNKAGA